MGIKKIQNIQGTLNVTDGIQQNGTDISNIYATKTEVNLNLAVDFSESKQYALGDAVLKDNLIYVCTSAITTSGPWDSSKWARALPHIQAIDNSIGFSQEQITWTGYYYANVFWQDQGHNNRLPNRLDKLYVDVESNATYVYIASGEHYIRLTPLATSSIAGVMKLYSSLGDAEDGTITQKKISEELRKKVELDTRHLSTDERLDIKLD